MRHGRARNSLVSATLLATTVGLCSVAAAADLKIIVPAAPGGGWDQLGRGVQQTLQAAKLETLGGHVTMGGYQEFASQITFGKLRALAITSDKRLPGVNIPTLKEQGINVEFVDWRGLMAAPGISEAQRQELIKTVTQMVNSLERM